MVFVLVFMVKTTINLDEEIYAEIVKESIEKYGSTKNISKIINQRLRNRANTTGKRRQRITFRVSKSLLSKDVDAEIKAGWEESSK
jgi:hypothetical protein